MSATTDMSRHLDVLDSSPPAGADHPRGQWLRLWQALPAARLLAAAQALCSRYEIEDLELPQSGLGLLPLRDGVCGEAYFLGEIPLARAWVRIRDAAGGVHEGAAVLVDDRAGLARALAVLDGILAAALPGCETARALLVEGERKIRDLTRARGKLLAATRVDFSLLGSAEGGGDD